MNEQDTKAPLSDESAINTTRRSFNLGMLSAGLTAFLWPWVGYTETQRKPSKIVDYIVVGSGAGGGPLAARLAQAGYTVAVIEAGLDPAGQDAANIDPTTGILYQVPAFAGLTAEHPLLSWDFYVKHYKNQENFPPDKQDSKWVPGKGILYPRGSALGGSTAHNAMLFIYPQDQDWDDIAELTGDRSWRASNMRRYFQRLEKCEYCQRGEPGFRKPGHGFSGYMSSSLFDKQIFTLAPDIKGLSEAGQKNPPVETNSDDARGIAKGATGSFVTPINVDVDPSHSPVRVSLREHLINTRTQYPKRLSLITGALATKVITRGKRAIGIEFMQNTSAHGPDNNLYEADKRYDPTVQPETLTIYASKEVILSAGVYNTPQLLKLSGIGPRHELQALGIRVVKDLPGVGENLQDRYEISVNVQLVDPDSPDIPKNLSLYSECKPSFTNPASDPCFVAWSTGQGMGGDFPFFGPYANNAQYNGRVIKSDPKKLPDLFVAGQATAFNGFVPGFSLMPFGRTWTWLILKAHTNNTKGTVKLKSTNPRQMPDIQFNYFEQGGDEDLAAVVKGVNYARSIAASAQPKVPTQEINPGSANNSENGNPALANYIRKEAWGHHASCSTKIGADDDPMAVLDSRFRVRGITGLRVVDACVFPRVPGFFPVAAIMMIGEKAADVILRDAQKNEEDHDHNGHGEHDHRNEREDA